MPSYNTSLLPASTGLSLGNQNQKWDATLGIVTEDTLTATTATVTNLTATTVTATTITGVQALDAVSITGVAAIDDVVYATPGESVAAAIARLPSGKGKVVFDEGIYPGGVNISTPDIILEGTGMPSYDSSYNFLTGGTIIQGGIFAQQGADRLTIRNLGVDCGPTYVGAHGGVPLNVLGIFNVGQVVGAPIVQSPIIENVTCLGFSPTAAFHCLILENVVNARVSNVYTVYNTHGLVIKGGKVNVNGMVARGHSNDGIIVKSDNYAPSGGVNISNFIIQNLSAAGDTGGMILQGVGSPLSFVNVSNGTIIGVAGTGIYIQGAGLANSASQFNINNVTIDCLGASCRGIQMVQDVQHVNISNCNLSNLTFGINNNTPDTGNFNDFNITNCSFTNISTTAIQAYGRTNVSNCDFVGITSVAIQADFDVTSVYNNTYASIGSYFGGVGTVSTNTTSINSSTLQVVISVLATPVAIQVPGGFSGLLRVQDKTLGGGALFLIDPTGGSQLLGTSQITGMIAAQVTFAGGVWKLALSGGAVPRTLAWTIYA